MIMSAQYFPATQEIGKVDTKWVGRPQAEGEQVFALFAPVGGILADRWYFYTNTRDAVYVPYDKLPEAVRLAYMLMS